jgi:lysozyme
VEASQNCIDLITASEGFSATVYNDVAGNPTIGYGHKLLPGETFEAPITEDGAIALLKEDLAPAENSVSKYAPQCNQNQFDALCDFAYNLGVGKLQIMLAHGWDQVPVQMPYWVNAGGKPQPGLVTRRANEVALFNTPV